MSKQAKTRIIRAYDGCEVIQDDLPQGKGAEPVRMQFLRFHTIDLEGGKAPNQGTTPWVMFTTDGLQSLADQLSMIVASIRRIEAGEDPESLPTGEGITISRLSDRSSS